LKLFDPRVYVITTNVPALGRRAVDVARAAVAGGATVIQYRDKTLGDTEFLVEASEVGRIARDAGVAFIVNDRIKAALDAGADGVHLGQSDGCVAEARQIAGPDMLIGVSASNMAEAREAEAAGADYIGVGPVFATGSKTDAAPPIGLEELARIVRDVNCPVVAIGGIEQSNIDEIIAVGAAGAAHIAAISEAPDMAAAVAAIKKTWERI
jgi:thiamine-phosphate pyrophosphorylase